jgi:orotate phosphoribosyltransferase/uridine monophosphate synthetase
LATGVDQGNLWIARALFDLGGIRFGDFTLGETAKNSPIHVNPRVLFSQPILLRRVAEVIESEVKAGQARRRPRFERFSLVAGVPFGGLQLALAFALQTDTSLVYVHPGRPGANVHAIEGRYVEGDHALVLDDLMTGGGSLLRTAEFLEEYNIGVVDAIVLIDREEGGTERLRHRGIHVTSILTLRQMTTYYYESRLIEKAQHERVLEYLEGSNPARGGQSA